MPRKYTHVMLEGMLDFLVVERLNVEVASVELASQ